MGNMNLAWRSVQGNLVCISAGGRNVWGCNRSDEIWRYNWDMNSWEKMPGAAQQISCSEDGAVWCINRNEEIFSWTGCAWEPKPGRLRRISVASRAHIWGCNNRDEIYYWNMGSWQKSDGACREISVGVDGVVFCTNANMDTWVKRGGPNSQWHPMNHKLKKVSCRDGNTALGLASDGSVWAWGASSWRRLQSQPLNDIAVGGHQYAWGLDHNGGIWHHGTSYASNSGGMNSMNSMNSMGSSGMNMNISGPPSMGMNMNSMGSSGMNMNISGAPSNMNSMNSMPSSSMGGSMMGGPPPPTGGSISISVGGPGLGVSIGLGAPDAHVAVGYPGPGYAQPPDMGMGYPPAYSPVPGGMGTPGMGYPAPSAYPQPGFAPPAQAGYPAAGGYQTTVTSVSYPPVVQATAVNVNDIVNDVRRAFAAQQVDSLKNAIMSRHVTTLSPADCGEIVKCLWKQNQVEAAQFLRSFCPDHYGFRAAMEKNMWNQEYKIWSHL